MRIISKVGYHGRGAGPQLFTPTMRENMLSMRKSKQLLENITYSL